MWVEGVGCNMVGLEEFGMVEIIILLEWMDTIVIDMITPATLRRKFGSRWNMLRWSEQFGRDMGTAATTITIVSTAIVEGELSYCIWGRIKGEEAIFIGMREGIELLF